MGKKGPLWWRESDWLLRGSSAANQILLRHSGPILSYGTVLNDTQCDENLYLLKRRTCTNFQLTFLISFKSRGCQTTVRSVRPVYISRFIAIFALQNN